MKKLLFVRDNKYNFFVWLFVFWLPGTALFAQCYSSGECDSASTNIELKECLARLWEQQDKKLNSLYPKVIMLYDQLVSIPDGAQYMRIAQRAWIDYRDDACQAEFILSDGGTIGGAYFLDCNCRITHQRVTDFESLLGSPLSSRFSAFSVLPEE